MLEMLVRERNSRTLVGLPRGAALKDDLAWLLILWIFKHFAGFGTFNLFAFMVVFEDFYFISIAVK